MSDTKIKSCSDGQASSYFEGNEFYLLGTIDSNTEKEFFSFASKQIEPELKKLDIERKRIKIHISSPGGYVAEALAIVGAIEYYKEKGIVFETHVRSLAASAATLISISGSEGHRYINRYATYMIHQPSGMYFGELSIVENSFNFSKAQWKIMKDIYTKNSDIAKDKLNKIYESKLDWYVPVQLAKKISIVDHII